MLILQYNATELGGKKAHKLGMTIDRYRVSFRGNGNVLQLESDDSYTT